MITDDAMSKISRREFVQGTAASIVIATGTPLPKLNGPDASLTAQTKTQAPAAPHTAIKLVVNGVERHINVEDRWTLAELLRDHLRLTGTKVGCDRGECGACTVLLDGKPIYSCSYLAAWVDGRSVQTVEGLGENTRLHPLQKAFIDHDGPQCGFCTPGQLMSAQALLQRNPRPTAEEVRAALTGNICRCSNYNRYVEAVLAAATSSVPHETKL